MGFAVGGLEAGWGGANDRVLLEVDGEYVGLIEPDQVSETGKSSNGPIPGLVVILTSRSNGHL